MRGMNYREQRSPESLRPLRSPSDLADLIADSALHCSAIFNKSPLRRHVITDSEQQHWYQKRVAEFQFYLKHSLKFQCLPYTCIPILCTIALNIANLRQICCNLLHTMLQKKLLKYGNRLSSSVTRKTYFSHNELVNFPTKFGVKFTTLFASSPFDRQLVCNEIAKFVANFRNFKRTSETVCQKFCETHCKPFHLLKKRSCCRHRRGLRKLSTVLANRYFKVAENSFQYFPRLTV